jgi:Tfp pilus assembly protein PilV
VLVALVILGLSVLALLELYSSGLRLSRQGQELTQAVLYARGLLEEALAEPGPPAPRSLSLAEGFRARVWSVPLEAQEGVRLYRVHVQVRWGPRGEFSLSAKKVVYETQ